MLKQDRSREKLTPQTNRNCWELEVRNLPEHCNKEDTVHFIWKSLELCRGLMKPTNPIIQSSLLLEGEKKLTLLFRSFEETMNCLQMDRIYYGKKVLSFTSRYFKKPEILSIKTDRIKQVQTKIYDEFRKIYVMNLPCMPEHQIMNLLSEFGELKSFLDLTKDNSGSECFCEYTTDDATDDGLNMINATRIQGRQLIAKRAALMGNINKNNKTKVTHQVTKATSHFEKNLNEFYSTFDTNGFFRDKNITCVIILRDIIPLNTNTKAIIDDIQKQVSRIGPISRLAHHGLNVYVEYEKVEYAQIAYLLLRNKKYDGKMVEVSFYDPVKFADNILL